MPEPVEYAKHELEAMAFMIRILEEFCRFAADMERERREEVISETPATQLAGAVDAGKSREE